MKIKIAIATIALAFMAAIGASAQTAPVNEQVNVTVVMSFNGTEANPNSQIILHDKTGSWWWGIAIDAKQSSILPEPYEITVDNASTSYHKAYFTLAGTDRVPTIATYLLFEIAACQNLADAKTQIAAGKFGCVSLSSPATPAPTSAPTKAPISGGKRS